MPLETAAAIEAAQEAALAVEAASETAAAAEAAQEAAVRERRLTRCPVAELKVAAARARVIAALLLLRQQLVLSTVH